MNNAKRCKNCYYKRKRKGDYLITVIIPESVYKVTNNINKQEYIVDIDEEVCECKAFKYSRRRRGKKSCKHISLIKGIVKK